MIARERPAELVFRALLRVYPAGFRADYEREMTQIFRDRRREEHGGGSGFWIEVLWDVARSAAAMHADAARAPRNVNNQPRKGTMRRMAILAVLVGLIEVLNASLEGRAGRMNGGDAYSFIGVALGVCAAILLIVAGVALFRRGWSAAGWARVAAIGCAALVVSIRVVQPWMSIFATLLGIGFPIALLLFLYLTKRDGSSMRTTA
ncbi:MAG: hypothetical protein ABI601_07345 [bacterium]